MSDNAGERLWMKATVWPIHRTFTGGHSPIHRGIFFKILKKLDFFGLCSAPQA